MGSHLKIFLDFSDDAIKTAGSPSLLLSFEESLRCHSRIFPGEKIFIACSGGPDSVALFRLLQSLQKKWRFKLGILHFNHQLRKAADRDEHFVRKLATQAAVPIFIGSGKVSAQAAAEGQSIEEAGRKARYRFFVQAAKKHSIRKIAVGHTLNDQAETVLMRVLQGTGLHGLCAIRPEMKQEGISFVRPLLGVSKKEILDFLRKNRIRFCEDESNRSPRFLRNRIRRELLPWIAREINPRIVETLARIPAILQDESEFLTKLEQAAWKKVFKRRDPSKIHLNRSLFLKFPRALQFRVLDYALKQLDPRSGLSFDAWSGLRGKLARPSYCHSLPRDIDFSLTRSKLIIYKKFPVSPPI